MLKINRISESKLAAYPFPRQKLGHAALAMMPKHAIM